MANINIKTNFVDGEKLFAQQLNNNFKTIQEGMNADNKIIWQDGEEVLFKRYVTNDIESLPILDGSIIYDVEKGRHYIDYNGNRIQVGSAGKEVLVQDNEPTEEDNKIWIDTDFVNTMSTEVVDSLDGDETNMSPSVRAVKKGLLDNYSEEEQVIGTWFNGKPIYSKIMIIDSIGDNADVSLDLPVTDYEDIWIDEGNSFIKKENSESIGINWYLTTNDYLRIWINYFQNSLRIKTPTLLSEYSGYICLKYTKTTDSEVISNEV